MALRFPVIVSFSADDERLAEWMGSPVTKDWIAAPEEGGEPGGLSPEGFARLACEVAQSGDEPESAGIAVSYEHCPELCGKRGLDPMRGLFGYARAILKYAIAGVPEGARAGGLVIAMNLLGFDPSAKDYDAISAAWLSLMHENPFLDRESNYLVFMVRTLDGLVPDDLEDAPASFQDLLRQKKQLKVRAFSYHARESYALTAMRASWELPRVPVAASHLHAALNATRATVTEELVFRSNMQIGHFELSHVHLRTHYNIEKFVMRDFVKEYLFHELDELLTDDRKAKKCFVITGMHTLNLYRVVSEYVDKCTRHASAVFATEVEQSYARAQIANCDAVVVIADFVNTGKTMEAVIAQIGSLFRRNSHMPQIKPFAIAKMSNSANVSGGRKLHCLVEIPRAFYEPPHCALCAVGQPKSPRGIVVSPDRFEHAPEQLTPYDFWEIVGERDALFFDEGAGGEPARAWVSTVHSKSKRRGLIDRYKKWFTSLAWDLVSPIIDEYGRIDLIVTVDEDSGLMFSGVVAKAADLSERSVHAVPRDLPKGAGLADSISGNTGGILNVLLVDDGINTGATMRHLANYCAGSCRIVGALVLDCRLGESKVHALEDECGMEGAIHALYQWRYREDFAIGQLKKMMKRWDGEKYRYHPVGVMVDYHFRNGYTLNRIFKDNRRLYEDVFANEEYLDAGERRALVKVTAHDEAALRRLAEPGVRAEFPLLAATAQEVLSGLAKTASPASGAPSSRHSRSHDVEASEPSETALAEPQAGSRAPLSDSSLSAFAIPLFFADGNERRYVIGTGFPYRVPQSESGASRVLLVTCAHVVAAAQRSGSRIEAVIDGSFHRVELLHRDDRSSLRDVAVMAVEGLPDGIGAVNDSMPIGESRKHAGGDCVSYGYQRQTDTMPNAYKPLEFVELTSQSKYVIMNNKGATHVGDGSSGSPVFDSSNAFVGMIHSRVDARKNGQQLEVVPYSLISEAVQESLGSGKRGDFHERAR